MKKLLLTLIFFASGLVRAAGPVVEVPVQETCREHITSEPSLTINDWPKQARDREVNAYVVISYNLDGSGKAKDPVVTDSKPKGLFDRTTLSILERTDFAVGVQASSCVYVRTYGSVRRTY